MSLSHHKLAVTVLLEQSIVGRGLRRYYTLGVGDPRKICFDTIPSTLVMVLMSIDTDTEYL